MMPEEVEETISRLRKHYEEKLSEKDREISLLRAGRFTPVQRNIDIDAPFPKLVVSVLERLKVKHLLNLYLSFPSLINYAFVTMVIGVVINQLVLHALVNVLPLWLANIFAILAAGYINWMLTVGNLGYLFGFSARKVEAV